MTLNDTLAAIRPVDRSLEPEIRAHLDDLTKPPGSLGRLEELAVCYCLATGTARPRLGGKRIYCFAGDHGVADEGVSAYPKAVTPQMVLNMLAGGAAVNVLARHAGASLVVVDMGVDADLPDRPGFVKRGIRRGTSSITRGPAMSRDEARRAVEAGIALAGDASTDGVTLLGTGDMGIANTTPSAALLCGLLGLDTRDIVGRGTGIDDARLAVKREAVDRALAVNRAAMADGLDALAALGGFEIAGICGLILGAAARRIPVVVDGFISTAAAAAAFRMAPAAADACIFSHRSDERGHGAVLARMGVRPLLDLGMRLGEGTGAALAMSVVEAAVRVYNEMATFSSAGVSGKAGG